MAADAPHQLGLLLSQLKVGCPDHALFGDGVEYLLQVVTNPVLPEHIHIVVLDQSAPVIRGVKGLDEPGALEIQLLKFKFLYHWLSSFRMASAVMRIPSAKGI